MSKINRELVSAAVGYWSGFLRDQNTVVLDNGEPSQFLMMNALAKMGGVKKFDEDKIVEFELLMTEKINDTLNGNSSGISFSVDYHPDGNLRRMLDESIGSYNSMSIFPCKTNMEITHNEVVVKEGYGKPFVKIYPVEEKIDNTHLLNNGYNYVVFMKPDGIQIVINFKVYNCEFDTNGLSLEPDADSINVSKIEDKFYAKCIPTNDFDLREIKVYNFVENLMVEK